MRVFDGFGHLAIRLFTFEGFALVVQLFAAAQPKLKLDVVLLEIDLGRDQRESLLFSLADQLVDLNMMQQQLAHPGRIVVLPVTEGVFGDVHVVDEHLAVLNAAERFLEIHLAVADRLDLGSGQHNAGFKGLLDIIIVVSLFVGGDDLDSHVAVAFLGFDGDDTRHVSFFLQFPGQQANAEETDDQTKGAKQRRDQ